MILGIYRPLIGLYEGFLHLGLLALRYYTIQDRLAVGILCGADWGYDTNNDVFIGSTHVVAGNTLFTPYPIFFPHHIHLMVYRLLVDDFRSMGGINPFKAQAFGNGGTFIIAHGHPYENLL